MPRVMKTVSRFDRGSWRSWTRWPGASQICRIEWWRSWERKSSRWAEMGWNGWNREFVFVCDLTLFYSYFVHTKHRSNCFRKDGQNQREGGVFFKLQLQSFASCWSRHGDEALPWWERTHEVPTGVEHLGGSEKTRKRKGWWRWEMTVVGSYFLFGFLIVCRLLVLSSVLQFVALNLFVCFVTSFFVMFKGRWSAMEGSQHEVFPLVWRLLVLTCIQFVGCSSVWI